MHWIANHDDGPRLSHASVAIGHFIYSFGGLCVDDRHELTSAIEVHVLNTITLRWSLIPAMTNELGVPYGYPDVPFRRYGHTAVAHDRKAYIFGGWNEFVQCDILFCFDTKTLTWSRPEIKGTVPSSRIGHSACVYDDKMYIYGGGYDGIADRFFQDVHYLNLQTMTWTCVSTHGDPPFGREYHSALVVGHRMVVFGGLVDMQEEVYCPQIIYLDLKTNRWIRPNTSGESPAGRESHSAFIHSNLLYIFGGWDINQDKDFNDLHCFDPERNEWRLVRPKGQSPRPQSGHSCLVVEQRMYLFGGNCQPLMDPTLRNYSDTHVLDLNPTLRTLAMLKVMEYKLDISCLPLTLQDEICNLTAPNNVSCKPENVK